MWRCPGIEVCLEGQDGGALVEEGKDTVGHDMTGCCFRTVPTAVRRADLRIGGPASRKSLATLGQR